MVVKKQGALRVRKGESIYGPMTRDDFDRLLKSGRFALCDFVSVYDGPWMEVIQFLSPPESGESEAPLRVLRDQRIFGSLTHGQIARLQAEGRIANEDLVCAVGGPWMSVADFLAPPRDPLPVAAEDDAEPIAEAEQFQPLTWYRVYASALVEKLSDQWFLRVRGIHSAPLTRTQVQHLLFAREITADTVARHCTWDENSWRPIHAIPDLETAW